MTCGPDDTCLIQNYVDLDDGPGLLDFGCGTLTYDGHSGTDFQVRGVARASAGVHVVAAAPGVVQAVRDQMPDTGRMGYKGAGETNRALGNVVVVDHGGGWTTLYGHLRRGSVKVRSGERVDKGQALGEVGLSGKTEFPHLHFEVRKQGVVIDPFAGAVPGSTCGETSQSLWDPAVQAQLPYTPTGVICNGWSASPPKRSAVLDDCDRPAALTVSSLAIVWWIELFGVQIADAVRVTLSGPDGATLVETTRLMEKGRARQFLYVGKKRPPAAWSEGTYRARFTLTRAVGGEQKVVIDVQSTTDVR